MRICHLFVYLFIYFSLSVLSDALANSRLFSVNFPLVNKSSHDPSWKDWTLLHDHIGEKKKREEAEKR